MVNKSELLQALSLIRKCVPTTNNIQVLTCFCFDGASITGFNGMQVASVKFESNLSCAIHADTLYKLLNSYNTEFVDLFQNNEGVFIKSGKSKATIPYFSMDTFLHKDPNVNDPDPELTVSPEFLNGLEKCLVSVNKNPLIPNQYGVTLDVCNGVLKMFSTDNSRISRFVMETDCSDNVKVLLPESFCELLIAFGPCFLTISNNCVVGKNATGYISTAIQSGIKWLNYEERIQDYEIEDDCLVKTPDELIEVVKRCKSVGIKKIYITATGNSFKIEGDTGGIIVEEELDLQMEGEAEFPLKELEEALKIVDSIYLVPTEQPVIIGKSENYTYILGSL